MSNVVLNILSEFKGKKAFKQADTAVDKLGKSAKKLGTAMGLALSTTAITAFSRTAIKAFTEDEKSAAILANTIKNLGLEFEMPRLNEFIDNLSRSAGVADDVLRPALQSLISTTGSAIKSQEMLAQAVDISRGSGVDIATVVYDLNQAYLGNVKGLKKYNLGLTQTELKASSFVDIQKALNKQFSGSSAAYLETYAGKMELLNTAAGEAKETIGKGLVDALIAVTGSGSTDDLVTAMEDVAAYTANTVIGFGVLIEKVGTLNGLLKDNVLSSVLSAMAKVSGLYLISKLGEENAPYVEDPNSLQARQHNAYANAAARKKAEADAAKRAAALAASQKANTAELKKQTLTKKQQGLFDLEQIQRIAALKGQLTEEDAKKVRLQLALIQGNEYEAKKLTEEIANSIDSTGKLAESLRTLPDAKNPFAAWRGYLDELELQAKRVASYANQNQSQNQAVMPVIGGSIPIPTTNAGGIASGNNVTGFNRFGVETGGNQTIKIDLNVDGKLLAQVLQDASLNGNQVYVNRITGGFYQ